MQSCLASGMKNRQKWTVPLHFRVACWCLAGRGKIFIAHNNVFGFARLVIMGGRRKPAHKMGKRGRGEVRLLLLCPDYCGINIKRLIGGHHTTFGHHHQQLGHAGSIALEWHNVCCGGCTLALKKSCPKLEPPLCGARFPQQNAF